MPRIVSLLHHQARLTTPTIVSLYIVTLFWMNLGTTLTKISPSRSEASVSSRGSPGSVLDIGDGTLNSIEEEAREGDSTVTKSSIPDDLFFRIQRVGDRLVSMASSLIKNSTSNLAECYMGLRCNSMVARYSTRSNGDHFSTGVMEQACGSNLVLTGHQKHGSVTGQKPGEIMNDHYTSQKRIHQKTMKRKATDSYKEARKRTRYCVTVNPLLITIMGGSTVEWNS